MGRASSSKKVARAASTGGGRTSRGRTPWLWYSVMSIVVILGVLGVVVSRADLNKAAADPPAIGRDHWHAAYGIDICGKFHPGLTDVHGDAVGIHSHGDGLIHIHPTASRSAGKRARLGLFMTEEGVKLTKTSVDLPDRDKLSNGDKCGKKPGKLRVAVWQTPSDDTADIIKGDPNDIRLRQALVITIAFLPEGDKIPKPPSAANVTNPSDQQTDLGSTSTSEPAGDTSTTGPPTTVTTGPPTTKAR